MTALSRLPLASHWLKMSHLFHCSCPCLVVWITTNKQIHTDSAAQLQHRSIQLDHSKRRGLLFEHHTSSNETCLATEQKNLSNMLWRQSLIVNSLSPFTRCARTKTVSKFTMCINFCFSGISFTFRCCGWFYCVCYMTTIHSCHRTNFRLLLLSRQNETIIRRRVGINWTTTKASIKQANERTDKQATRHQPAFIQLKMCWINKITNKTVWKKITTLCGGWAGLERSIETTM